MRGLYPAAAQPLAKAAAFSASARVLDSVSYKAILARGFALINNEAGEPHIDGRPVADGERYIIRGVEWLVRREDSGDFQLHHKDNLPRFICTLVIQPTSE